MRYHPVFPRIPQVTIYGCHGYHSLIGHCGAIFSKDAGGFNLVFSYPKPADNLANHLEVLTSLISSECDYRVKYFYDQVSLGHQYSSI